jgi:nitrogen fixation/metabolism regulation signal transduction histidine kinase
LTVLASVAVSVAFANYITTPIKRLTKAIEEISTGNTNVQITDKDREDEIGDLARAFDRTMVSLKLAMRKIVESTKNKDEND